MNFKKTLLLSVILIAALLRLYNIYSQQPRFLSETIWVWSRSLTYIPTFSDSYVFYPSLFQVIFFIAEWIIFSLGYFFGFFNSIIDFDTLRLTNLSMFLCIGRFIVILFSVGTIFLVYKIGSKIKNIDMGFIAMLFLTFNYFYLQESRFLYYNVPVTFFIMLAFLFVLDIFIHGRNKDYIFTGLVIGIGSSLHYQGIFIIFPLLMAHFLRRDPDGALQKNIFAKNLWFCFSLAMLTFIICNLYILWQFHIFAERLCFNLAKLRRGYSSFPLVNGYIDYLVMLFKCDWLILIIAILGIFICIRNKKGILLAGFPILFYICYGKVDEVHPEWVAPILPFIALLSAYFLVHIIERIPIGFIKQKYLLFFSSVIVITPSVINIIKADIFVRITDIKSVTDNWISQKVPRNIRLLDDNAKLIDDEPILKKIGSEFFTPDFKDPMVRNYKGPTVKISGKIIFPEYKGGIITISLRSEKYYSSGPPDIALISLAGPGEYIMLAPVNYGKAIMRASWWESNIAKYPKYSSKDISLAIGQLDIKDIDLTILP